MDKKDCIRIVNWEKAQCITRPDAPFIKLYTSILDHDAVINLDDKSFRLIVNLWALAGKRNDPVFPANPKWLKVHLKYYHIKCQDDEPDLGPLLNAKDMYGESSPFLCYCDKPAKQQSVPLEDKSTEEKALPEALPEALPDSALIGKVEALCSESGYASNRAISSALKIKYEQAVAIVKVLENKGLLGKYVQNKGRLFKAHGAQGEKETERRDNPIGLSEEKKDLNPIGFKRENPQQRAQKQINALMQAHAQDGSKSTENPKEPDESDESSVSNPAGQTQTTSSFRGGDAMSIGRVIKHDFRISDKRLPWLDAENVEFADEVLDALNVAKSDDEIGAFVNWLYDLKAGGIPRVVLDELKCKAIEKARWINSSKCKKKPKKPSALLTHIMKGELYKRGIRMPDKRASPTG